MVKVFSAALCQSPGAMGKSKSNTFTILFREGKNMHPDWDWSWAKGPYKKKVPEKSDETSASQEIFPSISSSILPENQLFADLRGQSILLTMFSDQLNILGQVFRPIFCGKVVKVTNGFITLEPVIIKMSNAPFFKFPTPLSFPIERIVNFVPFDCETRFSIP